MSGGRRLRRSYKALDAREVRRAARIGIAVVAILVAAALPSAAFGAFPGANGRIAFQSDLTGTTEVYTMNPDGSDVRQLTGAGANRTLHGGDPAWSADSGRIAFAADAEIYVMNADGSGAKRLTRYPGFDSDPGWTSDGRIVFSSGRDPRTPGEDIWVMNADGKGLRQLTSGPGEDRTPAWSPDGTRVAFRRTLGDETDLMVLDVASGTVANLTADPSSPPFATDPSWFPDGSRIAFGAAPAGPVGTDRDIFVIDLSNGSLARLTTDPAWDGFPAWSPDGRQIVFVSDRDGDPKLFRMNADGSGQAQLTSNLTRDWMPDWGRQP